MQLPAPIGLLARSIVAVSVCMGFGAGSARAEPPPPEASAPSASPMTTEQWIADLDQLAAELPKRHKNAFFKTPRAEFEKLAASLRERFPGLSDAERALGLAALAAALGDGHTSVDVSGPQASMHAYALGVVRCADGYVISAAPSDHPEMLGAELTAIDGVEIGEVVRKVSTLYAWENTATFMNRFTRWFNLAEGLKFTGVAGSAERATFTVRPVAGAAGTGVAAEQTTALTPVPASTLRSKVTRLPRTMVGVAAVSAREDTRSLWFDVIEDGRVMYLRYNRCQDDKDLTVADACKSVRERLDRGGVERLIIDLRFNGGGDSALLDPFIAHLARRTEFKPKGSLVVLIGAMTFSSAQMNADSLRSKARAVVVGGPSGQKPNSYGEIKSFKLRHSGLPVWYSTKYWNRSPKDEESMMPDVLVEPTMADWLSGRDVVLERAVEFVPE